MAAKSIAQLGRDYWNHGEGALKVRWGTPGAMTRCHRLVMKHAEMTSSQAWGYCATRHHDVTGKWPVNDGRKQRRDEGETVTESRMRDQVRSVAFEPDGDDADGLTLSGYAAVFDTPTTVRDADGEFEEQISRGAFLASLDERTPVLMFEHGRHPLVGTMPLGTIVDLREDDRGLHVVARLTDNWLVQPVRDAVRDGAVSGMSFRFSVPVGGDRWERRPGQPDLRTVSRADVLELGPVVFPAYTPTTASIRSAFEDLPVVELRECGCDDPIDITGRPGTRGAGGGDPRDAGQRDAHPSQEAERRDREFRLALRRNANA